MTSKDSKTSAGRPVGAGVNTRMLAGLKVGDSLILPAESTQASILQAARNRFYNPARRLGIVLSYQVKDNNIRIRREA